MAVRNAFYEAEEALDYEHMPADTQRVAVVSPKIHNIIERYFETDARIPFQSMINDRITAMGSILSLSGFRIVKDASAGPGNTNADDAKHTLRFFRAGEGFSYAEQLREMAAIDGMTSGSEYDGWLVRGRMLFGSTVNQPSKLRIAPVSIT